MLVHRRELLDHDLCSAAVAAEGAGVVGRHPAGGLRQASDGLAICQWLLSDARAKGAGMGRGPGRSVTPSRQGIAIAAVNELVEQAEGQMMDSMER